MLKLSPSLAAPQAQPAPVRFGKLTTAQKAGFYDLTEAHESRDLFSHLNRHQLSAIMTAENRDFSQNTDGYSPFQERMAILTGAFDFIRDTAQPNDPTCEELRARPEGDPDQFTTNSAFLTYEVQRLTQKLVDLYTSPEMVDDQTFNAAHSQFINNLGC